MLGKLLRQAAALIIADVAQFAFSLSVFIRSDISLERWWGDISKNFEMYNIET